MVPVYDHEGGVGFSKEVVFFVFETNNEPVYFSSNVMLEETFTRFEEKTRRCFRYSGQASSSSSLKG